MSTKNLKSKTSEKPLVFGGRTYSLLHKGEQQSEFNGSWETEILIHSCRGQLVSTFGFARSNF